MERTAGAGVTVTVERIGEPRSLPASLDLSAFRIVQESLTNVVKHSGADRCHVVLEYGADSLLIEVTDPGAGVPVEAGVPSGAGAPARAVVPVRGNVPMVAGVQIGARVPAGAGVRAGPGRVAARRARPSAWAAGRTGRGTASSACGSGSACAAANCTRMPRPDGGFVVRARLPLSAGRP